MQKFNYHTHTYRCGHADLDMPDEDYVKEAIEKGFQVIVFTDHCPEKERVDTKSQVRMEYNDRIEYLNSIKSLKEKYKDKIKIEVGYEVEYLPGQEENLIELKNETDKLVLGQHFIYDDNKILKSFFDNEFLDQELIKYARYIEVAMELNIPDILAHPDIYMLAREKFGEKESEVANMVCKVAEKYNIPLEINLNRIFDNTYYENGSLNNLPMDKQKEKLHDVKYPCKDFWNIATRYNVRVLYGIDAHHRGQILLFNELIELANEIIGKEIIAKLNFVKTVL